jgi:hypothetical protein
MEIRQIMVQGQTGQKVSETPPSPKPTSWVCWFMAVVPDTQELVKGPQSKANQGKKFETDLKISKAKRAEGVAEVVALPSKCEAVSSNHSTTKRKRKRVIEGMNLIRVHYMYIWKYHQKHLLCIIKEKGKIK